MSETNISTISERRLKAILPDIGEIENGVLAKLSKEDLVKKAYTDETGLRNKTWWKDIGSLGVEQLIQRKIPFSLLWLDLNWLGIINSELGEIKADNLLRDIGGILNSKESGMRKEGDISIHWHGDTFIIILPGAPPSSAANAVFRVLNNIKKLEDKYVLQPTFSVGVTGIPAEDIDYEREGAEQVLNNALIAHSHAKVQTKRGELNVVIFRTGMPLLSTK